MGKNKPHKPPKVGGGGGKGSASSSFSLFSWKTAAVGLVGAVCVQLLLTSGLFGGGDAAARQQQQGRSSTGGAAIKRAKSNAPATPTGPPAVCPPNWAECPKVAGADWVALSALEQTPSADPSAEALAACHAPSTLLSPWPVHGMHLVCVLPPPPAAVAEGSGAAATIALFEKMEHHSSPSPRPSAVLLLPRLQTAEQAIAALSRRLKLREKPSHMYQVPTHSLEPATSHVEARTRG